MPRLPLIKIGYRVLLSVGFVLLNGQSFSSAQASQPGLIHNRPSTAIPAGVTYVVNTTADTPDADVGLDPACKDATGKCSLRAAIMQANFTAGADTITLPAGIYLLTRPGDDDTAQIGDLDITDDLAIQGAGSGLTIVDGNGALTGDRVFQVHASAKNTSFSGLTIRNGKKVNTFDEGGGLYWDGGGGYLHLNDVVVEHNTAYYDGGLSLNYSSGGDVVDINHLIVRANTSPTAAAGGLGVNLGEYASFDMRSSQIYSNTAYEGGGLYFQSSGITFGLHSVIVENTEIYSNTASLSAGFENHSGDANVPVVLQNSHLYHNRAGLYGAAIGNYGTLDVYTTTVDANTAGVRGGGLYNYEGGQIDMAQSTLSGNHAQTGGGMYFELFIHNSSKMEMTNTTLSANTASKDGGGIYAVGGQIKLFNATVADNQVLVPAGSSYLGLGAGVFITGTASIALQNALIADNTHRYGAAAPEQDDCFGFITSLGYSLIQTLTTNCTLFSLASGNITGQDPLLGPLENNGGSTQTQSPLPGSPAIDAGQTPSCSDATGAPLLTDQRGFQRPKGAACDIGAVEYYPGLYLPFVKK